MSPASSLHSTLDRLIERFAGGGEPAVVQAARRQFEDARGRVFEDEELWEGTSRCFIEAFVLEEPTAGALPRASVALASSKDEREAVLAWLRSYRSLFRVDSITDDQVQLSDLLGGAQFRVREERGVLGVSAGDVIEARLASVEDIVCFGRGFVFHPAGALAAMVRHIDAKKRTGEDRFAIIDFFASLRVQCERYRHVSPVRLYEDGGSIASGR